MNNIKQLNLQTRLFVFKYKVIDNTIYRSHHTHTTS